MSTDKPRADLVALLLQFEACAGSLASLHLTGPDAVPAVEAWVEMRGHRVEPETLDRRDLDGRTIEWTMWTVTPRRGNDWSVTCSLPDREATAQADQAVIAKVRAVLSRPRIGPQDYECTACGATMQRYDEYNEYQHEGCGGLVELKEQPQAAEGSV